ncbi:MAG: hypothetical protein ACP5U1_06540 [Desulfomonilaceae bacterium]
MGLFCTKSTISLTTAPVQLKTRIFKDVGLAGLEFLPTIELLKSCFRFFFNIALLAGLIGVAPCPANGSIYDYLKFTKPGGVFAVDPDSVIRSMDPKADRRTWLIGNTSGFPPFFMRTRVPGIFERLDILYPIAFEEDSTFSRKIKIIPLFESRSSKIPPFDYYTRWLTMYKGRSDMGQDYAGFFPFYGYSYRRCGVDSNMFFMFPFYYRSEDDGTTTYRFLWPFITYANSPARVTFKVWPLFGKDQIRNDYYNRFLLWPFFQVTDKYIGQEQWTSFRALPFPLYVRNQTNYDYSVDILWPLFTYYKHYATGHQRYTLRPFFSYGYGGGVEEFSILVYSSKKDMRTHTSSSSTDDYISLSTDEVVTERRFFFMSGIKKRYRKGLLVHAKYLFWPFAEYTWDADKGSHWKVPEIIPVKNDWWDLNLGRFLRLVDLRDTPITRELSLFFGLSRRTTIKPSPYIACPPKPGDDNWSELVQGAFRKN